LANQIRITATSFLAYFVMSGMLAPIGIISGPMAIAFDVPVTEITAQFSWLTMGILVGAVLALGMFRWVRLRVLVLCIYVCLTVCLVSLAFQPTLNIVGLVLAVVGVGCGIGLPAAAVVISKTYAAEQRASMLVITDGAFSVAGIICAWLAVTALAQGMAWHTSYLFVAGMAGLLVVLAAVSRYPESSDDVSIEPSVASWPLTAWLCIAALAMYTFAQNTMLWWLPQYAQTELGLSARAAGGLVGQFWSGMFVAQIFVAWSVFKLGVERLLVVGVVSTAIFSVPMWWVEEPQWLVGLAALWGFANLGLLKIVLSYASQFTLVASPKLVSSLLLGATTGTAISPWVSSQLVAVSNAGAALQISSLVYALMAVLLLLVRGLNRRADLAAP